MDWSKCVAVDRDPERMGGVWCFKGKRLAVATLFDYLEDGYSADEFIEFFPVATVEEIHEILRFAKESLELPAAAA